MGSAVNAHAFTPPTQTPQQEQETEKTKTKAQPVGLIYHEAITIIVNSMPQVTKKTSVKTQTKPEPKGLNLLYL